MTTRQDIRSNPLSGANDAAATAYAEGLVQLNLFVGDPVGSAEAATSAAPGFVMGHVLRAWLFLLSTEAAAREAARASWDAARDLPMTSQEAGHVAAIEHLLKGHWHRAASVLEDVTIAHPRDLLALQVWPSTRLLDRQCPNAARPHHARPIGLVNGHAGLAHAARHACLRTRGNG
jgi:hypothetical protein